MKLRLKSRLNLENSTLLGVIIATSSLMLWRLGSLVPGLAGRESWLPTVNDSLRTIWNGPAELPYTVSQLFVAATLPSGGYTASRLPSVLLGLAMTILMFWLLKQWYGHRLAIFGIILMITSQWLLHIARIADATILYPFAVTVLLVLAALWHRKQRPRKLLYVTALIGTILLYVPGFIWLAVPVVIIERKNILASLRQSRLHTVASGLLALTALAPLIHNLVMRWQDAAIYLGVSGEWQGIVQYAISFGNAWKYIFYGGYSDPVLHLAQLPVVSVFATMMFAVGVYLYSRHPEAARTRLLLALWLITTALVAMRSSVSLYMLMPLVVVVAVGGIGYMLHLWLKVFPRNPLARSFGIGLLCLVLAFAVIYNLRGYFVAWPNTEATRSAFTVNRLY